MRGTCRKNNFFRNKLKHGWLVKARRKIAELFGKRVFREHDLYIYIASHVTLVFSFPCDNAVALVYCCCCCCNKARTHVCLALAVCRAFKLRRPYIAIYIVVYTLLRRIAGYKNKQPLHFSLGFPVRRGV